jgi:DNA primase
VGLKVKVVTVEGAKDPDEYIKKYGKSSFEKLLRSSDGHIDYTLGNIASKYNMSIPEQKLSFVSDACDMLASVFSDIEREIFIQRVSEMSGISADMIRNDIKKRQKKKTAFAEKEYIKQEINKSVGYGDRINADSAKNLSTVKKEENLLGLLLLRPEYIKAPELKGLLSEEIFKCEFTKKVYLELVKDSSTDGEVSFGEAFSPDEMGRIVKMKLLREELKNNSVLVAVELAQTLKKQIEEDDEEDFFKRIESLKKSKNKS